MASIVGLNHLAEALIDAGNRLLTLPSTDELLTLLDETESLLRNVEQDQPLSMQNALIPTKKALVSSDLLTHPDSDVRVSVVSCLTEIVRITAPEAPYTDDQMKDIFRLTIEAFEKLADASSRSYQKAESVLDNVSKVKSCLVMLDLECDDLILQMFRMFLRLIRSDHPRVVFSSMEMIMITNVSPMAWSLVEKVLSRCARKLKPCIMEALKSSGTTLDAYSPVVTTICQTVFETPKVHNVVDTKENEDKLVLGHSRKETRSKSSSKGPARDGTRRINENEKSNGKQVWSESRDAETDVGVTGKRGRKPNSLMNPEEGYDIPWLSGKRDSLKKTPPVKESSPATTSRALTGSVKRSRVKLEDTDHDLDSPSSPKLKKLASCFRDEEENFEKESNREIPEDDTEIGESRKKTKPQKGGKKKAVVNSSGKRSSARTAAKKNNLEGASSDTPVPQSSKDKKKKVSQVGARPLAEESEETSKSLQVRSRTAKKEVGSDTNGPGADLVGKRVNIWWPLDKTFYEGAIESYSGRTKVHKVVYTDGESEELHLHKERWELLEDLSSASEEEDMEIDLPESIPLFDIMQRQKVKKSKNVESSSKKDSGKRQQGKGRISNR
ncbi:hypothetical protein Bca52824_085012 [Brassica carinata]|uniref:Uncharacterized protein n=1 Tax=Brassica carinata TaxID=52824 RepID=A0A8X7PN32_BRACI|nr:hypothetical protein Bca52824_085012 [Brassica carinata]